MQWQKPAPKVTDLEKSLNIFKKTLEEIRTGLELRKQALENNASIGPKK